MYSIREENWAEYTNITHEQKYFIYQWSYLLSGNSLELERLPIIGLRGMLDEILDLFSLCNEGVINYKNLNNLAEEICSLLKEDMVIKKYYNEDFDILKDIFN